MAIAGLTQVTSGKIYSHPRFYRDDDGNWKLKYLLVLAKTRDEDIVFRLLTTRAHGRPQFPACYTGNPYPGYFLGTLGPPLEKPTWVDLRGQADYDGRDFSNKLSKNMITYVRTLPTKVLCEVLDCAARSDDTTNVQESLMRDMRAELGCL